MSFARACTDDIGAILLRQPRVLAAGSLDTLERRIGALPEREEPLVGAPGRVTVGRKRVRTRAPKLRERVERRRRRLSAAIENLLKLGARRSRVFLLKVGLAAQVRRPEFRRRCRIVG